MGINFPVHNTGSMESFESSFQPQQEEKNFCTLEFLNDRHNCPPHLSIKHCKRKADNNNNNSAAVVGSESSLKNKSCPNGFKRNLSNFSGKLNYLVRLTKRKAYSEFKPAARRQAVFAGAAALDNFSTQPQTTAELKARAQREPAAEFEAILQPGAIVEPMAPAQPELAAEHGATLQPEDAVAELYKGSIGTTLRLRSEPPGNKPEFGAEHKPTAAENEDVVDNEVKDCSNTGNSSTNVPVLLSDKMPREMGRVKVRKNSYSKQDYYRGFLNKNFTSDFLINMTKPLRKVLETTPVYVVLNGQDEIVLAHELNFGAPKITKNKLSALLYDFCGDFLEGGTSKRKKLGFVFMSYRDATVFRDAILESAPDETRIVGVAIHCVSLDSAYGLIRSHHPGTDFRLIPNLNNLVSSFSLAKDSRFLFQEDLYKLKSDSVSKVRNRDLSNLIVSPLQHVTTGVPVYSVQLQKFKRGNIKGALQYIGSRVDSLAAFFTRPHKLGRRILKGQLTENHYTEEYLFFDHKKALDFCRENNGFVVRLPGSYLNHIFDSTVQKPIIFVTNLETLLEGFENDLIELSSNNSEMREIYSKAKFAPAYESEKPWDAEEKKLLNSPIRKACSGVKVRFNILKSVLRDLWIA